MITRTFLVYGGGIVLVLLTLGVTTTVTYGETPLQGGFEISLLSGYIHEPLQGIDSIVGRIGKKDGLQIQYEMGGIPAPGGLRLGGHFVNQALQVPEKNRLWIKEQKTGGRTVHVAYSKDNRLVVSSASTTEGINFHALAKTPGDIADVLLMVLTVTQQKAKQSK